MWFFVFGLVFCFGFVLGYGCTVLADEKPAQDPATTNNDNDNDNEHPVKRHFYLAGAYRARDTLVSYIDSLKALGYECTFNWAACEAHSDDHEQMGYFASKDIDGVANADVVVAIMDDKDYAYRGTFTEIGCALGLGIPVVIYCPRPHHQVYARSNCFFCHPAIRHVSTWDEATQAIEEILD